MHLIIEPSHGNFVQVLMQGTCDKFEDLMEEITENVVPFLEPKDFYLETNNGKLLRNDEDVQRLLQNEVNTVRVMFRMFGGKGGFGSMLRAIGAQMRHMSGNHDECRDLSGRRFRHIDEERRLRNWVAKQAEREKEKEEAKKRRLDKLRQISDGSTLAKIDDHQFLQQSAEIIDSVVEGVEEAFRGGPSGIDARQNDASSSNSDVGPKETGTVGTDKPSASGCSNAIDLGPTDGKSGSIRNERKAIKRTMFDEDLDISDSSDDEEADEQIGEPPVKVAKLS